MKAIDKNTSPCRTESNKYTLDLVNEWINNADTKISIVCGLSSVVLALITFGAEHVLRNLAKGETLKECVLHVFGFTVILACITFLASLWYYFLAINPCLLSGKSKIEKPKYSIFYKDISEFSNVDDYMLSVTTATEEDFNKEIVREIYINSCICTKKMKKFKIGMWLSVASIFLAVVASVLFYFAIGK